MGQMVWNCRRLSAKRFNGKWSVLAQHIDLVKTPIPVRRRGDSLGLNLLEKFIPRAAQPVRLQNELEFQEGSPFRAEKRVDRNDFWATVQLLTQDLPVSPAQRVEFSESLQAGQRQQDPQQVGPVLGSKMDIAKVQAIILQFCSGP